MADIHITLDEIGFPGQWFDLVDPGTKSAKQFKAIAELAAGEDASAGQKFIAALVKAWNILNPETGEALPPPTSADIEDLPLAITKRLTDEINERMENLVPFQSRKP